MEDKLTLIGHYQVILRDALTGEILEKEEKHNIIVSIGKLRLVSLINGVSIDYFRDIAIGIGTNAANAVNVALQTEVRRESATLSYEATNKAKFDYIFSFGSGEEYDITEAGVFSSDNTMLDRFTFSPKSVDITKELEVIVTIQVS